MLIIEWTTEEGEEVEIQWQVGDKAPAITGNIVSFHADGEELELFAWTLLVIADETDTAKKRMN